MSLEGKTAVVIGASGQHNFGVAIAKALANDGAKVIVSGRRQAPLETLASEIGGIAIPCDMGDEASIQSQPRARSACANTTESSGAHPPSTQSVADTRTPTGMLSGTTARIASKISSG